MTGNIFKHIGLLQQVKNNSNSNSNELLVNLEGHKCTQNSRNIILSAGEKFTGSVMV